jgi:hypothetical protein
LVDRPQRFRMKNLKHGTQTRILRRMFEGSLRKAGERRAGAAATA